MTSVNSRNLGSKLRSATFWVSFSRVFTKTLGIVVNIALVRYIAPSEFGIVGMAMAVSMFASSITSTGFTSALIQNSKDSHLYLDDAWTIELIRNLLLFVVIASLGFFFGESLGDERLAMVLPAIALIFPLKGLKNIGIIYFRKNLDFKSQFKLNLAPLLLKVLLSFLLAVWLRNAWALIISEIAFYAGVCVASYLLHPYRPRFRFNKARVKTLFNFGMWIFVFGLARNALNQGVTIFIGKLSGMNSLGFYNRAQVFSTNLFREVESFVWQIGYPAFSSINLEDERIRRAFLATFRLTYSLVLPMLVGFALVSRNFVLAALTSEWLPIVPFIHLLCIDIAMTLAEAPCFIVFQSVGKPRVGALLLIFRLLLVAATIFPFFTILNTPGVVVSLIFGHGFAFVAAVVLSARELSVKPVDMLKSIAMPVVPCLVVALLVVFVDISIDDPLLSLVIAILVGGIAGGLLLLAFDMVFGFSIAKTARAILGRKGVARGA